MTQPWRPFRTLAKYFFRGLIVVVPIAVTAIAVSWIFVEIDTWINLERLLNRKVPGAGVVLTVVVVILLVIISTVVCEVVGGNGLSALGRAGTTTADKWRWVVAVAGQSSRSVWKHCERCVGGRSRCLRRNCTTEIVGYKVLI